MQRYVQTSSEVRMTNSSNNQPTTGSSKDPPGDTGTGTEADRKGGQDSAKRQAERDWQDSAQESGE
jgi:hypothetical protein